MPQTRSQPGRAALPARETLPGPGTLRFVTVPSPVGELRVVVSDRGVRAVLWPEDGHRVPVGAPVPVRVQDDPVAQAASTQLCEYFDGERTSFDLPLDLVGTEFQLLAWQALAQIPYGETRTYGEQASGIGRPRAVRAVGTANGRNPLSIILPCHRVVGSDGSLTGYAGGLDTKSFLLGHERAVLAGSSAN